MNSFAGPAWITGGILLGFAVTGLVLGRRERSNLASGAAR